MVKTGVSDWHIKFDFVNIFSRWSICLPDPRVNGLLNACHLSVSESEDFDIEINACKHMLTAALDTSSTDRAGISDICISRCALCN